MWTLYLSVRTQTVCINRGELRGRRELITSVILRLFLLRDLCIKLQQNLNPAFYEELYETGFGYIKKFYHFSFIYVFLSHPRASMLSSLSVIHFTGSNRTTRCPPDGSGILPEWLCHKVLRILQLISKVFAGSTPLDTQVLTLYSSPYDLLPSSGRGSNNSSSHSFLLQLKDFRILSQSLFSNYLKPRRDPIYEYMSYFKTELNCIYIY